jgi:hypothetical protein
VSLFEHACGREVLLQKSFGKLDVVGEEHQQRLEWTKLRN